MPGRAAFERHLHHVRPRHVLEQLGGEMRARGDAARCVVELARFRFRERDELLHGFHRKRRMHDEDVRQGGEARDRHEIADRIERQLLVQARVDGERGGDAEQRVAVGRRFGDRFGSVQTARAGTVIDDERLPERLAHALRDHARREIGRAAGALRDDHSDGFHGKCVAGGYGALCGRSRQQSHEHKGGNPFTFHSSPLHCFSQRHTPAPRAHRSGIRRPRARPRRHAASRRACPAAW